MLQLDMSGRFLQLLGRLHALEIRHIESTAGTRGYLFGSIVIRADMVSLSYVWEKRS